MALNVGMDASLRQVGTLEDSAEGFGVIHVSGVAGNEVVGIIGFGLFTLAGDPVPPQSYPINGSGRITANGGEMDDNLMAAPDVLSPVTFHGGDGNDRLVGGAGDDMLFGEAGLDLLIGGLGADALNGGADQDYLDGQDDADTLLGGDGDDILVGGPGGDVLNGGLGYDTASYVSATVGVVINLELGTGSNDAQGDSYISIERIVGSPFADIMLGSAGSDNFAGGAGDDSIDGKDGDDLLVGDAGADTLTGGPGNDFAAYTDSPAGVSVSLLTGVGMGGDAQGDTLSGIENLQGSNFDDTLEGDNGPNWLRGFPGTNTLHGLGGNDLLQGDRNDDTLDGGDGNDTLDASLDPASLDPMVSGGHDTLLGGAGNDILRGDAGGDLLDGGDGADQIFGGQDGDTILGGAGDDVVHGAAGDDLIDGGEGLNMLFGEDGNDVITAGSGPDQISGGNGSDQIDAGDGQNVVNGDADDDIVNSGNGSDTIHGGTGNDTVNSGGGNDLVFGDDGNDTIEGGSGSDLVDGGIGDDFLSVGALRGPVVDSDRLDHLFGGAGYDTISADFSNQTVPIAVVAGPTQSLVFADGTEARDFENVHDLFTGSAGDSIRLDGAADDGFGNLLKTGPGNDVIYSGAGSDNVDAGDGEDFVNGGANDIVLVFGGFGSGEIIGFTGPVETLAGGMGNDTLSFEGFSKTIPAGAFGAGGLIGVLVNLGTGETDGAARGIAISGFENIIGTDYADVLTGDDGPNIIDPLRGGGTSPTATYNSGPDRIDGGGGDDTLRIDFSRFDPLDAEGVMTNGASISRLNLAHTLQLDGYAYYNIEHLQITGASKADGIYASVLDFSDVLIGLGGNDTLGGYGGADTLLGGDGDDVLTGQGQFQAGYFGGIAGGHDVFDGGPGDDLVEDFAFAGGNATALAADALFQLDGGLGSDTLSADFSNQTVPIVWNSATPTNVDFADGAYFHNFEALAIFATGSGNDSITQLGRVNNTILLGAGDDFVNAGLGVDTLFGGAGNDTAVLDFSVGDTADMGGVTSSGNPDGGSYFRPLANDFFNRPDNMVLSGFESVHLTGTSKADLLVGTGGDDIIFGGDGDDTLDGYAGGDNYLDGGLGNDILKGSFVVNGDDGNDTMIGGPGNDMFMPRTGNDTISGGDGNDVIMATDFPSDGYGTDFFDGGDGDDLVADGIFNSGFTYTTAATHMHLEGGAGIDTLSADFGNQTQAITFIAGQSNSMDFADGNYFRNFEALGDFTSGSGSDTIILAGRANNALGGGAGDDTINPGLGIDYLYGGPGNDLLILDFSVGDDANLTGVVLESPFLNRRDSVSGALVDSIFATEFEQVHITGSSKADTFSGTDGNDILFGGGGDDTIDSGSGDDVIDGGVGADTMRGGPGHDRYVVDSIADLVVENAGAGMDTVFALIDYRLGSNLENLTLGGRALMGAGNELANIIVGNARSNSLDGGDGDDIITGGFGIGLAGSREADVLHGGAGADVFVLGDADSRYYDDRSSLSPGTSGYAGIDDFTPSAGDRLQLHGSPAEYFLGDSPVAGVPGIGLFHDTNADAVFEPGYDELIAILDSPDPLTHANTIDAALFV